MQISRDRRTSNLIVGIVAALVGISVLLLVPFQIPGESWGSITDVQSPAFFPILNAVFLMACGLAQIITSRQPPISAGGADGVEMTSYPNKLVVIVALLMIYLFLIQHIGMVVSSGVAIAAMSVLLGYRNKVVIAISSIIFPIVIFVLFEKILKILLPHGVLF